MAVRLHVGGLPLQCNDQSVLQSFLDKFGEVKEVIVPRDKLNRELGRGFAFASVSHSFDLQKCQKKAKSFKYKGKTHTIQVTHANKPQTAPMVASHQVTGPTKEKESSKKTRKEKKEKEKEKGKRKRKRNEEEENKPQKKRKENEEFSMDLPLSSDSSSSSDSDSDSDDDLHDAEEDFLKERHRSLSVLDRLITSLKEGEGKGVVSFVHDPSGVARAEKPKKRSKEESKEKEKAKGSSSSSSTSTTPFSSSSSSPSSPSSLPSSSSSKYKKYHLTEDERREKQDGITRDFCEETGDWRELVTYQSPSSFSLLSLFGNAGEGEREKGGEREEEENDGEMNWGDETGDNKEGEGEGGNEKEREERRERARERERQLYENQKLFSYFFDEEDLFGPSPNNFFMSLMHGKEIPKRNDKEREEEEGEEEEKEEEKEEENEEEKEGEKGEEKEEERMEVDQEEGKEEQEEEPIESKEKVRRERGFVRRLSQEAMKKEWEMYRKELTTDYKRRKKAALNLLKKSQKKSGR